LGSLKIKAKLGLGFGLLLLITVIITMLGIINIRLVDIDYTYTLDRPLARYSIIRNLEVELMDFRRLAATAAFQTGNPEAIDRLEGEINASLNGMLGTLNQVVINFMDDEIIDADMRGVRLRQAANIYYLVSVYMTRVIQPGLVAARLGDIDEVHNMFTLAVSISDTIYAQFHELFNDIRAHMAGRVEHNNQTVRTTMLMLGALGYGSLLIGIIIAVLITRAITKPVRAVVAALGDVANGNLAINLGASDTDETGMLTQSTQNLAGTLRTLMQDIDNMSNAHDKGDIDVVIPHGKFTGAYSEVAEKINYMVNAYLETQNRVVGVVAEITNGDFEARLEQLPGKKARLNDAVDNIREVLWQQHQIYHANPIPASLWDADLNVTDCNEAMIRMLGMSGKEEYIDKDSFFRFAPEYQPDGTPSREKIPEVAKEAFEKGFHRFTWVHLTAKKEPVPCDATIVRIDLKDSHLLSVYLQDLRPLKAAMEKAHKLEMNERIQLMFNATPLIIEYWDKDYNPIECNQTALDFYGFSCKEEYKERLIKVTSYSHPDSGVPFWELWNERLKEIFESGSGSFDFMERTQDGDTVFTKVYGIRMRYNDDLVVVTYSNDVTQLKENEHAVAVSQEALRYREKLLHTVNQAAEVLLSANNKDTLKALMTGMEIVGRCLNVDRVQIWRNELIDGELCFVMRYEWLSEIGKRKIEVPIGLNAPYKNWPEWLDMFRRGESMNSPISKLSPAEAAFLGPYEMVSIVNLPLFMNQELIGFFSVDDCEVERVFTSDEMDLIASAGLMFSNVFNKNLQAEKIAETNVQLEDALEQAISASRAKSEFLSTMSHEMRTPMNAIIGMAAIAKKENNNERKHQALNKVEKAAHHLLGIINDVLDMSKIEANKLKLQSVEIDLRNLLHKAVSFVEFRMEEKRHGFSVNLDNNVPFFYIGDDQRLTQVLTNLLTNAALYTPEEGEISLEVYLVKDEDGVCELRFEVADSGIGISKEDQERLFMMFERVDSSASSKNDGTGIGLAISKRLIELMGGKITVESELGKGARFIFTARLERVEKAEDFHAHSASDDTGLDDGATDDAKFAGKRLLLAEDVEINREILIIQLDGTGLQIDVAQNGREAVEMVAANPDLYDLVFMDMRMPEMDGLEATRQIRSLPISKELPIIAMTANVFTDDVKSCLEVGMNDHIGKPLDMRIVFEKLRKYL